MIADLAFQAVIAFIWSLVGFPFGITSSIVSTFINGLLGQ